MTYDFTLDLRESQEAQETDRWFALFEHSTAKVWNTRQPSSKNASPSTASAPLSYFLVELKQVVNPRIPMILKQDKQFSPILVSKHKSRFGRIMDGPAFLFLFCPWILQHLMRAHLIAAVDGAVWCRHFAASKVKELPWKHARDSVEALFG